MNCKRKNDHLPRACGFAEEILVLLTRNEQLFDNVVGNGAVYTSDALIWMSLVGSVLHRIENNRLKERNMKMNVRLEIQKKRREPLT